MTYRMSFSHFVVRYRVEDSFIACKKFVADKKWGGAQKLESLGL